MANTSHEQAALPRGGVDLYNYRELDERSGDGLQVQLMWRQAVSELVRDDLVVKVVDERLGDKFELPFSVDDVQGAREAFVHPFPYAASRGIDYNVSRPYAEAA